MYKTMIHHKSYPSAINDAFFKRKIHSAFISSIRGTKKIKYKLGICSLDEVQSVLVLKSNINKQDKESETSNILAKILKIKGETIIGDKALKVYIENKQDFTDLSKAWFSKYKLPFVFATFSFNSYQKFYNKMQNKFLQTQNLNQRRTKIPFYICQKLEIEKDVKRNDLLKYLNRIHYKIDHKENTSMRLFWKLARFS